MLPRFQFVQAPPCTANALDADDDDDADADVQQSVLLEIVAQQLNRQSDVLLRVAGDEEQFGFGKSPTTCEM